MPRTLYVIGVSENAYTDEKLSRDNSVTDVV